MTWVNTIHNRESERDRLAQKLTHGVNIHMSAPRRIGKTWTINRLAEDLRKKGWLIVEPRFSSWHR